MKTPPICQMARVRPTTWKELGGPRCGQPAEYKTPSGYACWLHARELAQAYNDPHTVIGLARDLQGAPSIVIEDQLTAWKIPR